MRKTNPNPQRPPVLSARLLLAARLLTEGRAVPEVAGQLKLNRGTVWRWTQDPLFKQELRRLHEIVATAAANTRVLDHARANAFCDGLIAEQMRRRGGSPILKEVFASYGLTMT